MIRLYNGAGSAYNEENAAADGAGSVNGEGEWM